VHTLANPIGPEHLLSSFGLAGLAIILFAECGLLIGFFLPGDTILLAAGISLSVGTITTPLWGFLLACPLAAIAGNLVGYGIGYRAGPRVFDRPNSKLFRPEYVVRARAFFDRFGWATVFLARFVPIVRTVTTVLAGVSRMRLTGYTLASVIGGIVWTDGVLLAGYWLGRFRFVRDNKGYIDYVVVAAIVLSLIPTVVHYLGARRRSGRSAAAAPGRHAAPADD
jgi:membrane-associated protein